MDNKNKKKKKYFLIVLLYWFLIIIAILFLRSRHNGLEVKPKFNGVEEPVQTFDYIKPSYEIKKVHFEEETYEKYQEEKSRTLSKGRVMIPSVGIDLGVYEGLNEIHINIGAAEQEPRDIVKVGEIGNYILTSHSSNSRRRALFTPLRHFERGNNIFVTDEENLYVYKSFNVDIINVNETTYPLEKNYHKPIITLYTCYSVWYKYPEDRVVVQGELTHKIPLSEINEKDFEEIVKHLDKSI